MAVTKYAARRNANGTIVEPPHYRGLAADKANVTAENGEAYIEMDTAKLYLYDSDNSQWREL